MLKIQKSVFTKLYRYYCRKILKMWWLMLFYSLISLFYFYILWRGDSQSLQEVGKGDWKEIFHQFWKLSFFNLVFMYLLFNQVIQRLTGRESSWGTLTLKKSKADDAQVLIFTPTVNRETVILTKFAAVATYFFTINFFLLTLPLFFYLWFAASMSALALVSFLLLNGVIFALINFLFLVPLLFYFLENYSILLMIIAMIFAFILSFVYLFFKEILQSPGTLPFLLITLFLVTGSIFFYLYWRDFLQKDLD